MKPLHIIPLLLASLSLLPASGQTLDFSHGPVDRSGDSLTTGKGGRAQVSLDSRGSLVRVGSNTRAQLAANAVKIDSGLALVSSGKAGLSRQTIAVTTPLGTLQVRGTALLAVDNNGQVKTASLEGSLKGQLQGHAVQLAPGQMSLAAASRAPATVEINLSALAGSSALLGSGFPGLPSLGGVQAETRSQAAALHRHERAGLPAPSSAASTSGTLSDPEALPKGGRVGGFMAQILGAGSQRSPGPAATPGVPVGVSGAPGPGASGAILQMNAHTGNSNSAGTMAVNSATGISNSSASGLLASRVSGGTLVISSNTASTGDGGRAMTSNVGIQFDSGVSTGASLNLASGNSGSGASSSNAILSSGATLNLASGGSGSGASSSNAILSSGATLNLASGNLTGTLANLGRGTLTLGSEKTFSMGSGDLKMNGTLIIDGVSQGAGVLTLSSSGQSFSGANGNLITLNPAVQSLQLQVESGGLLKFGPQTGTGTLIINGNPPALPGDSAVLINNTTSGSGTTP